MLRVICAGAAALAGLAGCGGPRQDVSGVPGAGCYALVRTDSPSVSVGRMMPDTVELEATPELNPDGRPHPQWPLKLRAVSRRPDAGMHPIVMDSGPPLPWPLDWDREFSLMAWRFTPPRSVEAVLHQNMGASWKFHFRISGDSLLGTAEYYDDVVGDDPYHLPLAGRPVACRPRTKG